MRRYLLAVSPLLVVASASAASAQQRIYVEVGQEAAVARAMAASASARPTPSASRPGEPSKEAKSDRLQAFEALKIDRRPSQLLEKWADIEKDAAAPEAPSPLRGEMIRVEWLIRQANWNGLGEYLKGLKEQDEAEQIYRSLLTKLDQQPTSNAPQNPAGQQFPEMQRLTPDDVWGVLTIAPMSHDDESLQSLAGLLTKSLAGGAVIDGFLATMEANAGSDEPAQVEPGAEALAENRPPLTRRQAAKLLQKAGMALHADRFLPSMEEAIAADDGEALNLLAAHYLTRREAESRTANLELAWKATQAVLASEKIETEDQLEALRRAVELSSRVRAELGKVWLEESFTTDPARGARILGSVGSLASQGLAMQPSASHMRLENLKLLSTAVEALLKQSPELGESWRDTLDLLATPWLREAELARQFDSTMSRGPMMRSDSYGNIYYADEEMMMAMQQQRQEQPRAIASGELLKVRPSDAWMALLDESVRPRFAETTARLHLKINEADEAFPYIERLAKENPEVAEGLVNEFLRVWATNHDPNSERRYMSPIYSLYGYSQRAEGIPLTRSKQVRNLEELAEWVRRLRALPLEGELDERLLVNAFTTAHSAAEVYDVESIRAVFGDLEGLDPIVLAGLAQQMRNNLAGLWRKPAVQEQSGTNRRKQDIEAEVRRGYQVAGSFLDDALARHTGNWALLTARAAIAHDEADYVNELAKSPEYAERRLAAIASLREAAAAYAASYDENKQEDESVEAYETWFHASMGACDLAGLAPEKLPLEGEAAKIRQAILALPGEAAERHMALFANGLFTGLRSVNPAVKYRYLKHGFEIVEDHPQAVEAKKAFDYYADLVTEIELRATVDGPAEVGHGEPFGIFVNLRHTKEIERESGGFGRYLQNQNNVQYSYNYGRPTENYRDKFEEGVREALADSFEVLSVTFEAEDVTSKADPEYGWRVTPYAYLLVKAVRPEIDRIPPMKLDLDFLDNSGYVVLPVETPMVPIDAGSPADEPRPATVLSVVQTLDERQSRDGKLLLEIKATARGLAPDLDRLVKLEPERFEIDSVEDQGVSVSRFDPDASDTAVVSERLWTISLRGTSSADGPPKEFQFAEPLVDVEEVLYQRYNDADLESVESVVPLASVYGETDRRRIWVWAGLGAVGLAVAAGAAFYATRRRAVEARVRSRLPEALTPLNVLALLQDARQSDRLSAERRKELDGEIARLERDWYSPTGEHRADLKAIAERWVEFA